LYVYITSEWKPDKYLNGYMYEEYLPEHIKKTLKEESNVYILRVTILKFSSALPSIRKLTRIHAFRTIYAKTL
jgi:hypothetical protein